MEDKLITLISYTTAADAHIAKTKLEDNGIPAFVFDDNIVGANPFYTTAVGGVKVKIPESYSEDALKVLKLISDNGKEKIDKCPECNSINITVTKTNRFLALLMAVVFMNQSILNKKKLTCFDCNYKWKA